MSNNNTAHSPLMSFTMLASVVMALTFVVSRFIPADELPRHEVVTTTDVNEFGKKINVTENVTRNDDGSTYVIFTTK